MVRHPSRCPPRIPPPLPANSASSFKIPSQPHANFGQQVFSQFFAIDAWNIWVFRRQNALTNGLGSRELSTSNVVSHQMIHLSGA
jgi:hypothetical protein